jgi:protein involved in polysaccharide export with SLBB domain
MKQPLLQQSLKIFIAISFLNSNLFAQVLTPSSKVDEEFLAGLPPSLRSEMESANSMDKKEDLEKLFRAETTVETNKMILQNIKDQLEIIEKRTNEFSRDDGSLKKFGENFFDTMQTSFMPINVGNLGADYTLDVGDSFKLILTGNLNDEHELMIQRDGSIAIPQFGKVSLAGKSLQLAEEVVSNMISTSAVGVNSFLSLDKVRDVQVLLVGGIENPGIYTLSGGSNILGAIDAAGGISRNGSFRNIELKRGGESIYNLDMYDVLVSGDFKTNITLRSGDTIFIHPVNFEVAVTGGVNHEAIFEILPDENLLDLIKYAGNFSQDYYGYGSIHVRRVDLKSSKILNVPMTQLDQFILSPRDSVTVPAFKNDLDELKKVKIEGRVARPGEYFIEEGDTIKSLIERAGGYLPDAYLYGAALYRKNALEQEKLYAQLRYSDTINHIISSLGKPNININPSVLEFLSEEIRSNQFTGRVIINLYNSLSSANKSDDLVLLEGDRIHIPSMQKVVHILGDFGNPINATFDPELSLDGYIKLAGGLKESAVQDIIIIDPDGKTHLYKKSLFNLRSNIDIYPGSIIYAQRNVGDLSGVMYASAVAPIISSLAISLASLNSISD